MSFAPCAEPCKLVPSKTLFAFNISRTEEGLWSKNLRCCELELCINYELCRLELESPTRKSGQFFSEIAEQSTNFLHAMTKSSPVVASFQCSSHR